MNIYPEKDWELHHYTTPLLKKTNDLLKEGYTDQFILIEEGLKSESTGTVFKPEDLSIVKHYRFEGTSDPGDMSILYAIKAKSGLKGMVVNAFGTYSDSELGDFMKKVDECENQNHPLL